MKALFASTTGRVSVAAVLAVFVLTLIDKVLGIHLNGTSPEMTGGLTVLIEFLLRYFGVEVEAPPVVAAKRDA